MVAFLRNRTELVVKPTDGGDTKSLIKGVNYSYSDGDLGFEWSPDSRYILSNYQGDQRMYNDDVCLIEVETGKLTDLTLSGYSNDNFKWALGGKAMTFTSDKLGYRSHGSWGAEGDVFIMFFDEEAYNKFTRSDDLNKIEDLLKDDKKAAKEKKKEEKEAADSTKTKKPEKVELELEGRFDRIVRLTRNSGRLGDYYLTPDGKKIYYSVQLEKGRDLVCVDLKDGSVKVVKKGFGGFFAPSRDGKNLFVITRLGVAQADPKNLSTKSISFRGEFEFFPDKEREYIFEHCWRLVKEKWYVADMHGVDWAKVGENYRQFLPYITDNFAFRELLSEMLGELNGSHTGARYGGSAVGTGHLGVIFDESYTGKGLKVKEFLPNSLLKAAAPEMKEGDLILSVEGKAIEPGTPWYRALARKHGKRIILGIKADGKKKDILVTPSSNDTEALYQRWVRNNEKRVEQLSGGRVGYVHVRGMNSASFREVYSKALGKYRTCDALWTPATMAVAGCTTTWPLSWTERNIPSARSTMSIWPPSPMTSGSSLPAWLSAKPTIPTPADSLTATAPSVPARSSVPPCLALPLPFGGRPRWTTRWCSACLRLDPGALPTAAIWRTSSSSPTSWSITIPRASSAARTSNSRLP